MIDSLDVKSSTQPDGGDFARRPFRHAHRTSGGLGEAGVAHEATQRRVGNAYALLQQQLVHACELQVLLAQPDGDLLSTTGQRGSGATKRRTGLILARQAGQHRLPGWAASLTDAGCDRGADVLLD
jgi:hypothetical protein